jgi:hypothetical protein
MGWYRTGTVAVSSGSPNITGTGTAWASSIDQAWGFLGPDGKLYEVQSVTNDTAIVLVSNYLGSSVSGAAYAMFPTQGYTRTLAQKVLALITDYANALTTSLAGLFGAGTVATPGVANAADADTGIFWPAANAVAISAGGVEIARATGSGLAVGLTTASARLHVGGNATTGRVMQLFGADRNWAISQGGTESAVGGLSFYDTVRAAAALTLDLNGNVGIGSIAPYNGLTFGQVVNSGTLGDRGGSITFNNNTTTVDGGNDIVWAVGTPSAAKWAAISGKIKGNSGATASGDMVFSTGNSAGLVERLTIDRFGNTITTLQASPPALAVNGQMVFNLTSNTNLRVSVRGSDGTTRVANITLA